MATSSRPTPSRRPRTLQYHATAGDRPLAAGRVIVVGLVAFGLAALLNADSLSALANRQPFGWKRTVARGVLAPVRELSHVTRLNEPRAAIQEAIDRDPEAGTRTRSVVTATTRPAAAPPPAIRLRRPTAGEALRLWVGGDSMAQELGTSVVEKATDRGSIDADLDYRISTGLTRPDYFDWPAHLRDEVLPGRPEVIVIIFGANDAQPMEVDGTPFEVRTPQWQAEYRRRVALTMDLLGGDGRLVIWVGQPHMRKAEFSERMDILDEIYRSEASRRPWIRFVDSRPVLAPEGGGYSAYLPDGDGRPQLARQADGIHLSRFGADRLADAALAVLDVELAKAPRPRAAGRPGGSTPSTTP